MYLESKRSVFPSYCHLTYYVEKSKCSLLNPNSKCKAEPQRRLELVFHLDVHEISIRDV